MRTVTLVAMGILLTGPAVAQGQQDPLTRACRLVATNLIEREQAADLTSFRIHRAVTVQWTSSELGPREHVCHFLDGSAEVPELVATETKTGAESRRNQWLNDQNGLIWACFVNQPNFPSCTENADRKLDPSFTN